MTVWTSIGFGLSLLSAVLAVALAWRLVSEGLRSTYRWLFVFLAFDAARTLVSAALPLGGTRAALLFVVTEPAAWILNFLMVREIFLLVLADHRGIASASKTFVRYAFVLAILASGGLLWMDYRPNGGAAWILQFVFTYGRVALVALVALLAAGVTFMSWFPVTISRNAAVLLTGYAVYFGAKGVLLLLRNLGGILDTRPAGAISIAIYVCCLAAGFVLLRQRAEEARREYVAHDDPEATARLMAQLEEINRKLEASTRR